MGGRQQQTASVLSPSLVVVGRCLALLPSPNVHLLLMGPQVSVHYLVFHETQRGTKLSMFSLHFVETLKCYCCGTPRLSKVYFRKGLFKYYLAYS